MPKMWGVDMSGESANRLKMRCALTQGLEEDGWLPAVTAPHDGTEIELRVVHINAAYGDDAGARNWIDICRGKWTDFNGGGFTWHGLCGSVCQWRQINWKSVEEANAAGVFSGTLERG